MGMSICLHENGIMGTEMSTIRMEVCVLGNELYELLT